MSMARSSTPSPTRSGRTWMRFLNRSRFRFSAPGSRVARRCAGASGRNKKRIYSEIAAAKSSLRVQRFPAILGQRFQRRKADLVVHLLAAAHPIAQIDIRQRAQPGRHYMIQDHVGAEAAANPAGMEEGIVHGKAVLQPVGKGTGQKRPGGS